MRFIVDNNIIISAMIRDATTRNILLNNSFQFVSPDFIEEEISNHLETVSKKSGLTIDECRKLLKFLLYHIEIVPIETYKINLKQAYEIMKDIDEDDTPYVALALSIDNDGIWSDDTDFDKQNEVKILKTRDMVNLSK